jgi:hypothetical protein
LWQLRLQHDAGLVGQNVPGLADDGCSWLDELRGMEESQPVATTVAFRQYAEQSLQDDEQGYGAETGGQVRGWLSGLFLPAVAEEEAPPSAGALSATVAIDRLLTMEVVGSMTNADRQQLLDDLGDDSSANPLAAIAAAAATNKEAGSLQHSYTPVLHSMLNFMGWPSAPVVGSSASAPALSLCARAEVAVKRWSLALLNSPDPTAAPAVQLRGAADSTVTFTPVCDGTASVVTSELRVRKMQLLLAVPSSGSAATSPSATLALVTEAKLVRINCSSAVGYQYQRFDREGIPPVADHSGAAPQEQQEGQPPPTPPAGGEAAEGEAVQTPAEGTLVYRVAEGFDIQVRTEADLESELTGTMLEEGQVFEVCEEREYLAGRMDGGDQLFLRVTEGHGGGWVFLYHPQNGTPVCEAANKDGDFPNNEGVDHGGGQAAELDEDECGSVLQAFQCSHTIDCTVEGLRALVSNCTVRAASADARVSQLVLTEGAQTELLLATGFELQWRRADLHGCIPREHAGAASDGSSLSGSSASTVVLGSSSVRSKLTLALQPLNIRASPVQMQNVASALATFTEAMPERVSWMQGEQGGDIMSAGQEDAEDTSKHLVTLLRGNEGFGLGLEKLEEKEENADDGEKGLTQQGGGDKESGEEPSESPSSSTSPASANGEGREESDGVGHTTYGRLLVNKLIDGGMAARCGRFMVGDTILEINGTRVIDISLADVYCMFPVEAGQPVTFLLQRDGDTRSRSYATGQYRHGLYAAPAPGLEGTNTSAGLVVGSSGSLHGYTWDGVSAWACPKCMYANPHFTPLCSGCGYDIVTKSFMGGSDSAYDGFHDKAVHAVADTSVDTSMDESAMSHANATSGSGSRRRSSKGGIGFGGLLKAGAISTLLGGAGGRAGGREKLSSSTFSGSVGALGAVGYGWRSSNAISIEANAPCITFTLLMPVSSLEAAPGSEMHPVLEVVVQGTKTFANCKGATLERANLPSNSWELLSESEDEGATASYRSEPPSPSKSQSKHRSGGSLAGVSVDSISARHYHFSREQQQGVWCGLLAPWGPLQLHATLSVQPSSTSLGRSISGLSVRVEAEAAARLALTQALAQDLMQLLASSQGGEVKSGTDSVDRPSASADGVLMLQLHNDTGVPMRYRWQRANKVVHAGDEAWSSEVAANSKCELRVDRSLLRAGSDGTDSYVQVQAQLRLGAAWKNLPGSALKAEHVAWVTMPVAPMDARSPEQRNLPVLQSSPQWFQQRVRLPRDGPGRQMKLPLVTSAAPDETVEAAEGSVRVAALHMHFASPAMLLNVLPTTMEVMFVSVPPLRGEDAAAARMPIRVPAGGSVGVPLCLLHGVYSLSLQVRPVNDSKGGAAGKSSQYAWSNQMMISLPLLEEGGLQSQSPQTSPMSGGAAPGQEWQVVCRPHGKAQSFHLLVRETVAPLHLQGVADDSADDECEGQYRSGSVGVATGGMNSLASLRAQSQPRLVLELAAPIVLRNILSMPLVCSLYHLDQSAMAAASAAPALQPNAPKGRALLRRPSAGAAMGLQQFGTFRRPSNSGLSGVPGLGSGSSATKRMSLDLSNLADDMKGLTEAGRPRASSGAGAGEHGGGGVNEDSGLTGASTALSRRTAVLWASKRTMLYEVVLKPGESVPVTATARHQRPLLQVRQALPHELEEAEEEGAMEGEQEEEKPKTMEQKLSGGISIPLGTGISIPITGDDSSAGGGSAAVDGVPALAAVESGAGAKEVHGGLVWMEKEVGNVVTWYSHPDEDSEPGVSPPVSPTSSTWGEGIDRTPYLRITWGEGSHGASSMGSTSTGVRSASSCVTIGVPWIIFNWTNEPLRLHSWPHEGGEAWRLATAYPVARAEPAAEPADALPPAPRSTYAHLGEESTLSLEIEVSE